MSGFSPKNPEFRDWIDKAFGHTRILDTLGATTAAVEPGYLELAMPNKTELRQFTGALSAGVITGLADMAAGGGRRGGNLARQERGLCHRGTEDQFPQRLYRRKRRCQGAGSKDGPHRLCGALRRGSGRQTHLHGADHTAADQIRGAGGLTPAPIGRHPLVGEPQAFGRLAGLVEHVNGNTAARKPIAADAQPLGL